MQTLWNTYSWESLQRTAWYVLRRLNIRGRCVIVEFSAGIVSCTESNDGIAMCSAETFGYIFVIGGDRALIVSFLATKAWLGQKFKECLTSSAIWPAWGVMLAWLSTFNSTSTWLLETHLHIEVSGKFHLDFISTAAPRTEWGCLSERYSKLYLFRETSSFIAIICFYFIANSLFNA